MYLTSAEELLCLIPCTDQHIVSLLCARLFSEVLIAFPTVSVNEILPCRNVCLTIKEIRVHRFLVGCQIHQQTAAASCLLRHSSAIRHASGYNTLCITDHM